MKRPLFSTLRALFPAENSKDVAAVPRGITVFVKNTLTKSDAEITANVRRASDIRVAVLYEHLTQPAAETLSRRIFVEAGYDSFERASHGLEFFWREDVDEVRTD